MVIEELLSPEQESQAGACAAAVEQDDLAGALFAIEGAPAAIVAADRALLDAWAARVRSRGRGADAELTLPEAQARALGEVLGGELGFRGEEEDYHHPRNSHLHEVLSRRAGLPILLSAVWIEVGRRAGIQVEGVGMPGHFVARVGGAGGTIIDPFGGGDVLTEEEARTIVARMSQGMVPWRDEYLEPSPLPQIIDRVLTNLANAYEKRRDRSGLFRVLSFAAALHPGEPTHLLKRAAVAESLGACALASGLYADVARRFPGTREADVARERQRAAKAVLN